MVKRALLVGYNSRGNDDERCSSISSVYELERILVSKYEYTEITLVTDDTARGPTVGNVSTLIAKLSNATAEADTALLLFACASSDGGLQLSDGIYSEEALRNDLATFAEGSHVLVLLDVNLREPIRLKYTSSEDPVFLKIDVPLFLDEIKPSASVSISRVDNEVIEFYSPPSEDEIDLEKVSMRDVELPPPPPEPPVSLPLGKKEKKLQLTPASLALLRREQLNLRYPTVAQGYLPLATRRRFSDTLKERLPNHPRPTPPPKVTIPQIITKRRVHSLDRGTRLVSHKLPYHHDDWVSNLTSETVLSRTTRANTLVFSLPRKGVEILDEDGIHTMPLVKVFLDALRYNQFKPLKTSHLLKDMTAHLHLLRHHASIFLARGRFEELNSKFIL